MVILKVDQQILSHRKRFLFKNFLYWINNILINVLILVFESNTNFLFIQIIMIFSIIRNASKNSYIRNSFIYSHKDFCLRYPLIISFNHIFFLGFLFHLLIFSCFLHRFPFHLLIYSFFLFRFLFHLFIYSY